MPTPFDIVGLVFNIGQICDRIYLQVGKVRANKQQVIRLGERVRVVHSGIQGLQGQANIQGFVPALPAIPAKKSPEAASVVGFAPETLRKPVSKTCSAPSLSASMGILGKRQSELLKDKVSDGVNLCYQYEDYDIAAILNIRLAQEVTAPGELGGDGRIQVLAPTDGLSPGILEMQLRENRERFTGARVVIIPYNVGHYHWIGILLEFNSASQIIKAIYVDSLGQHDFEVVQHRLNAAGYQCGLSRVRLLEQQDGTSCGAYTIENLILAVINSGVPEVVPSALDIRGRHLACLEEFRPDFYNGPNGFYQRQLNNRITALNTQFTAGNVQTVVFSVTELRKILDITQCIAQFSKQTLREQLWAVLTPKSVYESNKGLHLDEIRRVIKAITLVLNDKMDSDLLLLQELIKLLFNAKWEANTPFADELMNTFYIDYEQIIEIAKRKDISAYSPEQKEVQATTLEQIKQDEEFAKKLQSQFYSEKIDAVVVTGNMHTIPTQALHRLFTGSDVIVPSATEIPAEVDNLGEKLVSGTDSRKFSGAKPSADEASEDFLAGIATPLQRLQVTLMQIETVVTNLAMESGLLAGIKKIMRARSGEGKLQDYSLSLQSCCIELQLGLQVQSFVDDKQNMQDLRADMQDIAQQEAEIFNELRAQLQQQNQLDQKNDYYQQVEQQQLDCFRQEFRQYVNPQEKPRADLLPHDLRIPLDEVSFNQYLTSGSFGQFFLGTYDGKDVIIEQIKGELSQEEKEQVVSEVQVMSKLRSPYITQLYGVYASEALDTAAPTGAAARAIPKETQLFYIMEYVPRGDLKQVLSKETLSENLRGKISLELACALNYLHTQTTPYLHRDLKPENVLLTAEYGVKLADFGLAKACTASIRTIKEPSTAFNYMSPEFLRGDTYNLAAEVYSFGRLLWYIWSNTEPAYGAGLEALPANIAQPYRDIITACLGEPARRPMMAEIIRRLQISPAAAIPREVAAAVTILDGGLFRQGQAFEKNDEQRAAEYYERAAGSPAKVPLIKESDYSVDRSKRLGRGGFGEVFIGSYHGQDIAVKELLLDHVSKETKKEMEREAGIMAALRHGAIVQFLGLGFGARGYAILMEFMPMGSLFQLLHSGQPIALDILLQIAKDISSGLSYLHAQNIVHQDLKSLNVLLGRGYRAKLSDFGLSKIKSETASLSAKKGGGGTAAWMAPEVAMGESSSNFASDMYSLGMVFWELFARKIPFLGLKQVAIAMQTRAGKREEIPSNTPVPLRAIITQCWQLAGQRPTARDVAERLSSMPTSSRDVPATAEFGAGIVVPEAYRPQAGMGMLENPMQPSSCLPVAAYPDQQQHQGYAAGAQPGMASAAARAPATNPAEVSAFLKLVAEGEQEQAEAILQRKRELALYPGNVTDLSGRAFHNITALQYAVWALDWQMWSMLLRYMDRENISAQLNGMETGSWVRTHGLTAEWLIGNLLKELGDYINNYDRWFRAQDWASMKNQWSVKVGTAQRNLPVHVVNEYCHPKEAFDPLPDFKSAIRYQTGWRTRRTDSGEWFTAQHDGGSLGSNFACTRGTEVGVCCVARFWTLIPLGLPDVLSDDDAVQNLLAKRLQQHAELIDTYKPAAGDRPGK